MKYAFDNKVDNKYPSFGPLSVDSPALDRETVLRNGPMEEALFTSKMRMKVVNQPTPESIQRPPPERELLFFSPEISVRNAALLVAFFLHHFSDNSGAIRLALSFGLT